jgi:hypothetical protein
MSGNLAVILMVVCVVAVVLAASFAGTYYLDRSVGDTAASPPPHPAE